MRRRKLSTELVVLLLVGIGLHRDRPITDVFQVVDLIVKGHKIIQSPICIPLRGCGSTNNLFDKLLNVTAQHSLGIKESRFN
ncbi:hypothetical protein [Vibrio sp. TRT 2004]|uniref:hypothetical protein n=1 Tax=Vibrio sp. TRT 2004 TaxID=3418506 RepID=UPI003CFA981C